MFSFLRVSSSLGLLRTYYVASHNLELLILPSPPPTCWDHMCAPLNLVNLVHFKIWLQICYPSRKYMLRRHSESCQLTLLLVSKKKGSIKSPLNTEEISGRGVECPTSDTAQWLSLCGLCSVPCVWPWRLREYRNHKKPPDGWETVSEPCPVCSSYWVSRVVQTNKR